MDSPVVMEKASIIKKVVSERFDLKDHIKILKEDIAPLLIYSKTDNSKVYVFISQCVKLFRLIEEKDNDKILKIQEFVQGRIENIWEKGLEIVQAKSDDLKRVLGDRFWSDLTFDDVDFLIREIAPLMIYYEKDRKKMLRVDAPDIVLNVEEVKHEIKENPDLIELLEKNALIKKIKSGEGVTSDELLEIEKKLSSLNPTWTIDNLQNILKIDFIVFLRQIIGLTGLPDPAEIVKMEFDKYVLSRNEHYNAEQLKFLRLLKEVFIRTKHIKLKDLAKHPLTEERPLDKFTMKQLEQVVKKCNELKWK
jgi:type I restriction enzyme R subunit